MRVCPSCGHENADDVDFCASCGQYVRWEPTRLAPSVKSAEQAAVAAPSPPAAPAAPPGDGAAAATPQQAAPAANAAAPAAPAAPPGAPPAPPAEPPPAAPQIDPDACLLAARLPDQESATGEPITAQVEAGGQAQIFVLVRNQSGIVDNYDLAVQGIPDHWWTANPGTVYLVPYGTSEQGFEQEIVIHLHPPRAPEAEARPWPMAITAHSRAHNVQAAQTDATLEVAPYQEIESEMRPERKAGRKRARFAVAVRNKANAPVNVEVSAVDSANQTTIEFEHPQFPTRPGRRSGSIFWVKPLKQIWIGRKVEHRFTLDAKTVGFDAVAMPRMGVYVQKPWLPWWLLILLPLLIAAAIALWLLWPRNVTVPNLRVCGKVICAQKLLEAKGLKLGTTEDFATDLRPPGSVVNSNPSIGSEVEKGTVVDIKIAIAKAAPTVAVPDLKGMTLAEADAALKKAGLQRGNVTPTATSPQNKVKDQLPTGGGRAKRDSAVDIFLVEAPEPKVGGDATGEPTTTAPDGNKPPPPPPGGAGDEVLAGTALPTFSIVFDNGKDILTMPALSGKPVKALVKTKDIEEEPSLSPDGTLVAYRKGTRDNAQIFVVDPKKPQFAHPVTNEGFDDGRPAFSPDGKVIAFIRTVKPDPLDTDLCFVPAGASAARPRCIADPATVVSRPTWEPTGIAIAVISRPATDAKQVELEMYTTTKASSGNPANWSSQGLVTDKMHGDRVGDQVFFAAWSADGKQLAISANFGSIASHLILAKSQDAAISDARSFVRIRSCELSFATEGLALAIVQRDNTCSQAGVVNRLDPSEPDRLFPLTNAKLGAENPVWAKARG